jgi:hypothetical protein
MVGGPAVVPTKVGGEADFSPSPDRNLITFTVHPPELFEANDGGLTAFAVSKYFICAVGAGDRNMGDLKVYNQAGRLVDRSLGWTGEILNAYISRTLGKSGWIELPVIHKVIQESPYTRKEKVIELVRSCLDTSDNMMLISTPGQSAHPKSILGMFKGVATPPTPIGTDPSGRYLIFREGPNLVVSDTFAEDGSPLRLARWTETVVDGGDYTKAVQAFPFLAGYCSGIDGSDLPDGKHLASRQNGILTILQKDTLQRVYSDACHGFAVDPSDPTKLVYVNPTSRQMITVDLSQTTAQGSSTDVRSLPFQGVVTDLKFDAAGSFILCTVTDPDGSKERMVVLDKVTGNVCSEVPGVKGPITVDAVGSIYFIDSSNRLRLINSTLSSAPAGGFEALEQQRREKAAARLKIATEITLPELPAGVVVGPSANEDQLEDALAKTLQQRFKGEIAGVETLEALDRFEARLVLVKETPEFVETPLAFSLVDGDVESRRQALKGAHVVSDAQALLEELRQSQEQLSIADLAGYDQRIAVLRKVRGEVRIDDVAQREMVEEAISEISTLRQMIYTKSASRVDDDLSKVGAELSKLIERAGSTEEVFAIVAGEVYAQYQTLVNAIEESERRKEHRAFLKDIVDRRLATIEHAASQEAEKVAERNREAAEHMAGLLTKVTEAAARVSSQAELTALKGGALMAALTKASMALGDDDKDAVQASLGGALQRAAQRLKTTHQLKGIERSGGEITLGKERFPVAGEYSPVVRATMQRDETNDQAERLAFQDGFGRFFLPADSPLRPQPGTPEYDTWREKAMGEAVSYFRSIGRKVPELRSNWVITKHTVECLERIIRELNYQRESGQGIVILEGEAGTGKNVLIDLLAHLAKHERFLFACNYQTQKEDFTYEYAFSPQKGTYRVSAKLLEKLVTPYGFNAFDEINTLPPGVLKMLNPLLDERRTLFLADGREVSMDPTSYLVGFMNPRHYIGTQELSPEIVSRATFVPIAYPPLKRKVGGEERFAPDEALILSRSVRELASLSPDEFERAWDIVINGMGRESGLSTDQNRLLKGLHTIVKVANAVRTQYTNFQTNQSTQQMDFVFCLRTGASICRRLRPETDVVAAIKEVVLPKASSHDTRRNLELLITTT